MGSTTGRVLSSGMVGITAAASIFLIFTNQSYFSGMFSLAVIGLTSLIVFISSTMVNMTTTSAYCGLDMKKSLKAAFLPSVVAGMLILLFLLSESYTSLFSFAFNTINFQSTMTGDWKTASVFGLGLSIFWLTLYGQLIASGLSEVCETPATKT